KLVSAVGLVATMTAMTTTVHAAAQAGTESEQLTAGQKVMAAKGDAVWALEAFEKLAVTLDSAKTAVIRETTVIAKDMLTMNKAAESPDIPDLTATAFAERLVAKTEAIQVAVSAFFAA